MKVHHHLLYNVHNCSESAAHHMRLALCRSNVSAFAVYGIRRSIVKHWSFTSHTHIRECDAYPMPLLILIYALWFHMDTKFNCVRDKMEIIVKTTMAKTKELWKLWRFCRTTEIWLKNNCMIYIAFNQPTKPIYLNNFLFKSYRHNYRARIIGNSLSRRGTQGAAVAHKKFRIREIRRHFGRRQ